MVTSWEALLAKGLAAACASVAAGFFLLYHKKRDTYRLSFSYVLVFLNKAHLTALLKLIDPLEEAYLRMNHSRLEFRKLQTVRIQEAREYFKKMVSNAMVLQNFGYRRLKSNDDTEKLLARRLIECAIPVKIFGRGGLFLLFMWRRLRVLRHLAISFALADLKDVVDQALDAYEDMKEAALMLARHSEPGMEVKLAARL